ncbi:hypothetical protein FM038_26025 [Shewanella eurypsychrophilus]|uniref:Uncharacterized protein n=1 Tax=Shewanella eurypsychrophilus TaxID=2593656 RepID=A0ABX8S4P4_9GAMM|nr:MULTISPECIES: hypothetical protein [Shewanella]QXP44960.1 hypothetical protein FM038_26025 [Shewanella eurypsychrophilus]
MNKADWLAGEGLVLAIAYFQQNTLNPIKCLEAHKSQTTDNSYQVPHWFLAQTNNR